MVSGSDPVSGSVEAEYLNDDQAPLLSRAAGPAQ
jgi:hypothetical protein